MSPDLAAAGPLAAVCVIVPVHDGERTLARCLEAILASEDTGPIELIVVDDGSRDRSSEIARGYPCRLVSLAERRGPAAARNRGAAEARAPVLVFVDADVFVHPRTVAGLVKTLGGVSAAFATYAPEPVEPGFATAFYHALSVRSLRDTSERTTVFYSYCAVIRRQVFLELGGFDESFRRPTFEDVDLGLRLRQTGGQIVHRKDLEVRHAVRYSAIGLLRAYFRKSRDLAAMLLSRRRISFDDQGWTRRANWAGLAVAAAVLGLLPFVLLGPPTARATGVVAAVAYLVLALPSARHLWREHPVWGALSVPFLLASHATAMAAALMALGEALAAALGMRRPAPGRSAVPGAPARLERAHDCWGRVFQRLIAVGRSRGHRTAR